MHPTTTSFALALMYTCNFIISLQYTMPLKTEQQMKALNRSQLTEYIKLLHKDNEYIGQLAVDSKTKMQRV